MTRERLVLARNTGGGAVTFAGKAKQRMHVHTNCPDWCTKIRALVALEGCVSGGSKAKISWAFECPDTAVHAEADKKRWALAAHVP